MAHTATAPNPEHTAARRGAASGPGVNFLRVLKSEWIKVTTIPSTVIMLTSTVVIMVGLAALFAWQTTVLLDLQRISLGGSGPSRTTR